MVISIPERCHLSYFVKGSLAMVKPVLDGSTVALNSADNVGLFVMYLFISGTNLFPYSGNSNPIKHFRGVFCFFIGMFGELTMLRQHFRVL